ncbi:protein disulfide-isomerase A4-like [Babylonia areolata]|uniref:protein disulfide-isomerase A4-like n=1 Tax=Babylonia areolata TaxID=304850 RepID=UPI003FCEEFFB
MCLVFDGKLQTPGRMDTKKVLLLIFACFLLTVNISCEEESADESETESAGPSEDEDGVLILNKSNFADFIANTDTALVEFYAPWCGHCKQLAPEYAAAAKELKQLDPPVLLAKVDATVENELAQQNDVSGYPTMKFFKKGKGYEYDGPRVQAGIVSFMKARASPSWAPEPEAVVVLTQENFTDVVNQEELMLVEFYAPWCGHCKQLAPKYEKAAKMLKQGEQPIILAKVDATVESGLAAEYGVSGYPTMKVFRRGRAYEYKGQRDQHGIVEYMNKQRGEPAKPVDKEALKYYLQEDDVSVLAFFESDLDPHYRTYQDALQEKREDYTVGYTTDPALFKLYKANPKSVLVLNAERYYTKFEPKWHVMDLKEDTKSDEITQFILDHQFPLVGAYDGKVNQRYSDVSPLCIVFYTVDWSFDHREATQMWRNKIAEIAKDYKGIRFAVANDENNEHLLKDFGLEDSAEEMNIGIIANGKKYPMEAMEEFDADHIREFLDQFIKGKLVPHIKSQAVPKKQKGPVKVVVGKTFEKIVNDVKKDVLVELYAPWCGHCKKLEPVYKELAKKFKSAKDLVITKMDATANDVPDEYTVEGFPTIYFAPANNKGNPIKYEGGRELKDFVKFIKQKATVSLGSAKDEL